METGYAKSEQPIPAEARRVFKGIIFDVYQWEQKQFDGTTKTFEKLRRPDTVVVIAVTSEHKILVTYQEQPGRKPFTGLVGGRVDAEEHPLHAAQRELREETGYEASEWRLFDSIQPTSKVDWAVHYFTAQGAHIVGTPHLDSGEKISIELLDFDQFIEFSLDKTFVEQELKYKILEAKLDPAKMPELRRGILGD